MSFRYGPRPGHKDEKHDQIAADLRSVGASVVDASGIGFGFPDMLVGYRGVNILLEVKKPPTKRGKRAGKHRMEKSQIQFHEEWKGQKAIVETSDQAFAVLGIKSRLGR